MGQGLESIQADEYIERLGEWSTRRRHGSSGTSPTPCPLPVTISGASHSSQLSNLRRGYGNPWFTATCQRYGRTTSCDCHLTWRWSCGTPRLSLEKQRIGCWGWKTPQNDKPPTAIASRSCCLIPFYTTKNESSSEKWLTLRLRHRKEKTNLDLCQKS